MAEQIRKREFPHTAAALVQFDATAPARDKAWDDAETTLDLACAGQDDREALSAVQDAFQKDTQDINSLEHCRLVDIGFMRRMAQPVVDVSNEI